MRLARLSICAFLILCCSAAQAATVEDIRIWSENGKTRVVLDLSSPAAHSIFTLRGPDRLVVDLKSSRLSKSLSKLPGGTGSVRGIRSAVRANGQLRVVLDLNEAVRSRTFTAGPNSQYGDRLVIDLQRTGHVQAVKRASEEYMPGRDIVVAIDPGHGGHDPGAVGKGRTREKDVALQISRTLAARINAEPGMKAVLVRSGDYYVDHRRRMEIARRNKADLFISVHADAVDPITGCPAHRGLGVVISGSGRYQPYRGMGDKVSSRAFGHQGAGGQVAWGDPVTGLSFCLLTNGLDANPLRSARFCAAANNRAGACIPLS